MATYDFDVVVVGGGLVGLTLAAALGATGRQIALIEARQPAVGKHVAAGRNLALSYGSVVLLRDLGVDLLEAVHSAPIAHVHISEQGQFGHCVLDAETFDLPYLGRVVPADTLHAALWAQVQQQAGVTVYCPAEVTEFPNDPAAPQLGVVMQGGAVQQIRAQLLVVADGAQSSLCAALNWPSQTRDYGQTAVITTVQSQQPLAGQAYERFVPRGAFALLPSADAQAALIWTLPAAKAARLVAAEPEDFIAACHAAFGQRVGRLTLSGVRRTVPLQHRYCTETVRGQVVVMGNAAHSIHPLAAQGFNLGLRDAIALANCIQQAERQGKAWQAPDVLHAYQTMRETDQAWVTRATHGLMQLFGQPQWPLPTLRGLGLLTLATRPGWQRCLLKRPLGQVWADVQPRALSCSK